MRRVLDCWGSQVIPRLLKSNCPRSTWDSWLLRLRDGYIIFCKSQSCFESIWLFACWHYQVVSFAFPMLRPISWPWALFQGLVIACTRPWQGAGRSHVFTGTLQNRQWFYVHSANDALTSTNPKIKKPLVNTIGKNIKLFKMNNIQNILTGTFVFARDTMHPRFWTLAQQCLLIA